MPTIYQPSPSGWHWTTLIGPDAADYLQRLTSANVRALSVGQGSKGCFLNAQGKIRALFTVWHYRETEFGLEFDGGNADRWKKALFETIDQTTFAEKMTLNDVTGLECRWIFFDETEALPFELKPFETIAIEDEIRVCNHGTKDFGKVWFSVWGRPARLMQWADLKFPDATRGSREMLEHWRIQANRPWIDHELDFDINPLEAGFTDAIASNKGCYPGQEVIEKIVSLGSPARRLAQFSGQGEAPAIGEKVLNETGTEVGVVTSVVRFDDVSFVALGFVKKIHAKEGLPGRFEKAGSTAIITRIAPYE